MRSTFGGRKSFSNTMILKGRRSTAASYRKAFERIPQLQVVDACSGIRYLFPLMLLALLLAYWFKPGRVEAKSNLSPASLGTAEQRREEQESFVGTEKTRPDKASQPCGAVPRRQATEFDRIGVLSQSGQTMSFSALSVVSNDRREWARTKGFVTESLTLPVRHWKRVVLFLSSIPIAIFVNALRIAATGVLHSVWGPDVAEGFFHAFSGWLIFMLTIPVLLGEMWVLKGIGNLQSRTVLSRCMRDIGNWWKAGRSLGRVDIIFV